MNNKTILGLLVVLLVIFGGAAIYLGIQLSQTPIELPQTGSDPNAICDANPVPGGQNGGYLFICNANGDGRLFNCQDRQYHGANFAHACAQQISPGTSCSGLTNLGVGPWEGSSEKMNFVGCYYGAGKPQNCFCPSFPNGNANCYTDTTDSLGRYDSCGARYDVPVTTPPVTTPATVLPCGSALKCTNDSSCEDWTNKGVKQICDQNGQNCRNESTTEDYDVECNEKPNPDDNRCTLTDNACPSGYTVFTEAGVCGCRKKGVPTTTPPTTTPPTTTPPRTTPPTTTVIPKTAIVSDEVDRMLIGGLLFLIGFSFLATGKFVDLGVLLNNLINGKALRASRKSKTIKAREDFEEKFV